MNNNEVAVYAVLVTFNPDIDVLRKAFSALTYQVEALVVVDNGSNNIEEIKNVIANTTRSHLIKNNQNIGLAAAQNIGINYAKKQGNATHVILFDQDSIVGENFISTLVAEENKLVSKGIKLGAIGPSFYDALTGECYPATVYSGPFIKRIQLLDKAVEATFIIASGCMIRLESLQDIGMFLEDLFIDYIDVEWCLRAKSKGYKFYISPGAKMDHSIGENRLSLMGRTISIHSPLRRYYLVRNSFYMLKLPYIPFGYKLREIVFNFLRTLISLALSNERKKVIHFTFAAIKDGLTNKFGPYHK